MRIINLLINESLLKAELALNTANAETVVALCRNYARLLAEYRHELSELRGIPEINLAEASALGRELVEQARRAVKAAIEITDRDQDRIGALLDSFVSITQHQAADTFNSLKYEDADNWTASEAGVQRILPTGRENGVGMRRVAVAVGGASGINEPVFEKSQSPSGSHSAGAGIEMFSFDDQTMISEMATELLTVEEAEEIAGRLRREAFVDHKITFYK